MAENETKLTVIHGGREELEAQKANDILKALLVDKDREMAFQIADSLAPRGELALTANKKQETE